MQNNTAELIQRILEGDDAAFACLVRKYQKHVHALAWRKIGDFHIAEDITQETFLQVYRKLAKLKDPSQFPGWLYVIANRRCLAWIRKKRVQTQSLEDIDIAMTERSSYSRHVAAAQAESAAETKRELVKNLLAKLKESDRRKMAICQRYFRRSPQHAPNDSRSRDARYASPPLRCHRCDCPRCVSSISPLRPPIESQENPMGHPYNRVY